MLGRELSLLEDRIKEHKPISIIEFCLDFSRGFYKNVLIQHMIEYVNLASVSDICITSDSNIIDAYFLIN